MGVFVGVGGSWFGAHGLLLDFEVTCATKSFLAPRKLQSADNSRYEV